MCRALLATLLGLWIATPAMAEDAGAVIAALNDSAAECRYLRQLWVQFLSAKEELNKKTARLNELNHYMDTHPIFPSFQVQNERREVAREGLALNRVMLQKNNDFLTAFGIVKAKRNVPDPCPGVTGEIYEKQTATPSVEAKKKPLEERLRELKELREKNLITPDEYYQKRSEMLKGL